MPQHTRFTVAAVVLALASPLSRATAQQTLSRPFELLPGEHASLQFSVAQPGKVAVSVQARGEALVLSVTGPDGQVQEQTGTGAFILTIDVPAARASAGTRLWSAALRTARAYTTPPAGYTSAPKPSATGTMSISGPLASEAAMAGIVQPQAAALQSRFEAQRLAASRLAASDPAASARASLVQRSDAAHAQQLQALTARLSPATQAMIQQRGGMSVTKSIDPAAANRIAIAGGRANTMATQPAPGGVSRVGATTGAATAAPPTLALSSMSVTQGDPGTPVLFDGSGFGTSPGEVHFIVANGRDLKAPFTAWTDTQILSQVPAVDGLPAFGGYAYVQRADGTRSPMQPFAFKPTMATVRYCIPSDEPDVRLAAPVSRFVSVPMNLTRHPDNLSWFGFDGYDEYYVQTRLKNGWQAVEAQLVSELGCALPYPGAEGTGGAYIVETRAGTDSPYVKVRWWTGVLSAVRYQVAITLQGPSGLPYR